MATLNKKIDAWQRVVLARNPKRLKADAYIEALFDDFIELHGDYLGFDDGAIVGGIASFHGFPVTVLALMKGNTMEDNLVRNFGMANPSGYHKVIRLAKQAQKFKRPIVTFIDTPGAYPGKEAEKQGQARAIASCLATFSTLEVPIIGIVLSEGGSGGALALSVGDRLIMLENAFYSILSPEGFASILWKDESRAKEAANLMGLTANDLYQEGIVDYIVEEPSDLENDFNLVVKDIDQYLLHNLNELKSLKIKDLLNQRYQKYLKIGNIK